MTSTPPPTTETSSAPKAPWYETGTKAERGFYLAWMIGPWALTAVTAWAAMMVDHKAAADPAMIAIGLIWVGFVLFLDAMSLKKIFGYEAGWVGYAGFVACLVGFA